jgi:hypothetical protein
MSTTPGTIFSTSWAIYPKESPEKADWNLIVLLLIKYSLLLSHSKTTPCNF